MATQTELNVKLKVDSSGIKQGSDDAKNKVKQAANQMASDVKASSQKMEASMKDVSKATEGVSDATKTATNAVKSMEGQVSSSANRMKKDLGDVAEQVKGINSRQIAGIASRGFGIAGSAVKWAANNLAEEGSDTQTALNVGGAALTGAGSGVMLGAAIGSVVPVIGTAVGAAIGGAVGALTGAASELWEASSELKKSAQERQEAAQKTLQQAGTELRERDKLAGWEKENQILMGGIGKTWWQSKDGSQSISGEQRIFKVQEARQAELDRAVKERDDFVRQHQYDTGEDAERSAVTFTVLERAVQEAAQHLQALSPVVEAARRSEAEKAKAEAEATRRAEQEAAARDAAISKMNEQMRTNEANALKEEKRSEERTMAEYQRELQGIVSKPAETPTDQLTRIGGGSGYASYNNSTAQIQKSIENHLKEVINVLKDQISETTSRLDALINKDTEMRWASP